MQKNEYEEFSLNLGGAEFLYFIDGGFYRGEGYYSEPHRHSFCELIYVAEGSITLSVGDKKYCLHEGELFALPQETEHTVSAPVGASFTFLAFWDKASVLNQVYLISKFRAGNTFLRLLDYYYSQSTYRYELIHSCLVEISVHLLEALKKGDSGKAHHETGRNTRLYAIEYYMHARYRDNPSLEELAKTLHLSISQTDRTVRKLYGVSFTERIRMLRIEEAKSLLLTTDEPIYQIATSLGYATPSNFHLAFKQVTGKAPGEFRKSKP